MLDSRNRPTINQFYHFSIPSLPYFLRSDILQLLLCILSLQGLTVEINSALDVCDSKSISSNIFACDKIVNSDKKTKLIRLAESVLDDSIYCCGIKDIVRRVGLTRENVLGAYVDYNLDICAYGNEIYRSLDMRIVMHLLNLLSGSWHQEAQKTVLKFVKQAHPTTIADIGFGVPALYINEALKSGSYKITLFDLYESAFIFGKLLLKQWKSSWFEKVFLKKTNMENQEFIGNFDLYLFLDVIEHVSNPTLFLKKHVQLSPLGAKFLFSLPIGPLIPSHYMAWESVCAANEWLVACGLNPQISKLIYTNPDVDLFAEVGGCKFQFMIALCDKIGT